MEKKMNLRPAFRADLARLLNSFVHEADDVAGVAAEMRAMATSLETDTALRAEFGIVEESDDAYAEDAPWPKLKPLA